LSLVQWHGLGIFCYSVERVKTMGERPLTTLGTISRWERRRLETFPPLAK
jgi:hypothetical protein